MRFKLTRKVKIALIIIGAVVFSFFTFFFIPFKPVQKLETGVTFSREYAQSDLGLDPDAVLNGAINDLGIRRFRIPVYWRLVEPKPGEWDFKDLDHDIKTIGDAGGHVILAIGRKLPRWPECWEPDWWDKLSTVDQAAALKTFLETAVLRYRDNPAVITWQVENEPLFAYGFCTPAKQLPFADEVAFIKNLDPSRQIVTTDSGELSFWLGFGSDITRLGISVYRVVKNPTVGVWRYDGLVPPSVYGRKAQLMSLFGGKQIYVSEFQMEPWSNQSLTNTPISDQLTTMDITQMRKNFDYASRMGISPVDFWGVEWWYWMKEKQGHPEFWTEAKQFFQSIKD